MGSKRKNGSFGDVATPEKAEKRRKKSIGNEPPQEQRQEDGVPSGKKKSRLEYTDSDKKLAQLLESLSSETPDVRLQAAKELLTFVDPLKTTDSALVEKVLKRLIRGLCSSRKAARLGFSLVLTELVSQLYGSSKAAKVELPWNFDELLAFIISQTSLSDPENQVCGLR